MQFFPHRVCEVIAKRKFEWQTIHSSLHILRLIWIFLQWTNTKKTKTETFQRFFSSQVFRLCQIVIAIFFVSSAFCILQHATRSQLAVHCACCSQYSLCPSALSCPVRSVWISGQSSIWWFGHKACHMLWHSGKLKRNRANICKFIHQCLRKGRKPQTKRKWRQGLKAKGVKYRFV